MSLLFRDKLQSNYYSSNAGLPYVSAGEAKKDSQKAAQRERYLEAGQRLEQEFKADAFAELEIVGHPRAEQLYAKAWERGHSSGFHEIFVEMEDMADLIK